MSFADSRIQPLAKRREALVMNTNDYSTKRDADQHDESWGLPEEFEIESTEDVGHVAGSGTPDGCVDNLDPIPSLKDLIVDWFLQSVEKLLPSLKQKTP